MLLSAKVYTTSVTVFSKATHVETVSVSVPLVKNKPKISGTTVVNTKVRLDPIVSTINYSTTTIKQKVQEVFGENSIMVSVASCESRFRQFNKDGTVLRGIQNPKDVGVMQVNEFYHLDASRKLGYNIHTLEGNLQYAKYLYDRQGTTPWNWSKPMWSKGECRT